MKRTLQYDVAVIGGGPGGVAAALGAFLCGCSVVLIERAGYLGGQFAGSNIPSYCGFFDRTPQANRMVGGVGFLVLKELEKLGVYHGPQLTPGKNWAVPVEPEAVKLVMDRLTAGGPKVLLHAVFSDVKKENGKIREVVCQDDEGAFTVAADQYIDATGDGNLAYMAGAETIYGDAEGRSQMATRVLLVTGIDEKAEFLPGVFAEAIARAENAGLGPFSRKQGTVFRWLDRRMGFLSLPSMERAGVDAEIWTCCEQETRKEAWEYLEAFRRYVPGMEHAILSGTGSVLGVREGRRIRGEETMAGQDVFGARKRPDSVGRGCWPVEIHTESRKLAPFQELKENGYYSIPLGILKVKEICNLWTAGRVVSADREAYASLRVGGTAFVTGQAAGVAAAMRVRQGEDKKSWDALVACVQKELLRQGALL